MCIFFSLITLIIFLANRFFFVYLHNELEKPLNQEVQYYNSQEAATILGVNVSTIKRWTDEGILTCIKTAGGHRKFIMKHLSQFLETNRKSTKNVSLFPLENETDLKISSHILKGDFGYLAEQIKILALASNREKVQKILNGLYLAQYPLHGIYDHLLTPVLHEIGTMWNEGKLTITEEHLGSQTIRDSLNRLQGIIKLPASRKGRALCINLSSELHDIALKMVDHVLEVRGFKVYFSGQRTPIKYFENVIENFKPSRIYVSSSYVDNLEELQAEFNQLCKISLENKIEIYVGGQGFDRINFSNPAVVKRMFSMEDVFYT